MHSHMPSDQHPKLRKVPWVQINAQGKETVTPVSTSKGIDIAPAGSEEQLEVLGYI